LPLFRSPVGADGADCRLRIELDPHQQWARVVLEERDERFLEFARLGIRQTLLVGQRLHRFEFRANRKAGGV
jgi:hypothetical protein